MTLFELSRYNPAFPMYEQNLILLPHLATLGIGIGGKTDNIINAYPYYVIGMGASHYALLSWELEGSFMQY